MIVLRPDQERALQLLREGYRAGHLRQILAAPCGFGKTVIASAIARGARAKDRITLFIVDRITLADQAIETMERCGLSVSVLRGSDSRITEGHGAIIASVQSLTRRPLPHVDLVIVDEVHVLHRAHTELFERLSGVPVIGLSATPFAKGLGSLFSNLVNCTSVRHLTAARLLVPVVAYGPSRPALKGVHTRAGDYALGELADCMNRVELHADIVSTWQRVGEGRQTIIFGVDIKHSKAIAAAFIAAGVRAAHLDGYATGRDRKDAVAAFKSGEITVLTSVACLTTGFDAPNASCIVVARPTKSPTLHLQMIGRGLRTHAGKVDCVIIDHAANIERHGLPEDIEIGELDRDTKTWCARSREGARLVACPKCKFLKPRRSGACPKCGAAAAKQIEIHTRNAEIVRLDQKCATRQRKAIYRELRGAADKLGKRPGWAFHLYQSMFGESPARDWRRLPPLVPSHDVIDFARSQAARFTATRRSA